MRKITLSLDDEVVRTLERTARRLDMPKSHVVREAIVEYGARADRLGPEEQRRLLEAFDELVPRIPARPEAEVAAEQEALRRSRRGGGRATRP